MEISRASSVGVVYGGLPVPEVPLEQGVIGVNADLTPDEREMLEKITGNPHVPGGATSALGSDIYDARIYGALGPHQNVSVKFIDSLIRQYGGDDDHAAYAAMLRQAREYLQEHGSLLDLNA